MEAASRGSALVVGMGIREEQGREAGPGSRAQAARGGWEAARRDWNERMAREAGPSGSAAVGWAWRRGEEALREARQRWRGAGQRRRRSTRQHQ